MYKPGGTIKSLLARVQNRDYILPAIQREFVWGADRICNLFDSLMQGYPFGTFLFWKIQPEKRAEYQFYDFVRHYHERDQYHCELLKELPEKELVAVLDGQQRITALNIGLRGSYAWKMPGKWWSSDDAFPQRYLYLNLLGEPDVETGSRYDFQFLSQQQLENVQPNQLWYRVSDILNVENLVEISEWIFSRGISDPQAMQKANRALHRLYEIVHSKDVISYYEETEQDLERVLNIFIRMNSGGVPLSYSDLLLSIAVAQWETLDARDEIHRLVDEMNQIGDGFTFTKDLVLKAGLMLSDIGSVGFKVENFNKSNMAKLEANWSAIREALLLSVRLFASYGFNGQNLRASSSILPIAYYLYVRMPGEGYLSRSEHAQDRESVRKWLVRSLLKASGIWGSGLDTLLSELREVIREHGQEKFPTSEIEVAMSRRGKGLQFSEEEIEELCELEYGGKSTFALLSLLFPGFDFSQHFHVDHIYPKARFTRVRLRKAGISAEQEADLIAKSNRLPNLQLMVGSINNEKRQKMPHEWYAMQWPDPVARQQYMSHQAIDELPETLLGFSAFYDRRKATLKARIQQVLN